MLWFRLLLIISDSIAFHQAFSRPNRTPSEDQLVAKKGSETVMRPLISSASIIIPLCFRMVTLAEAGTLVAAYYPEAPLSRHIHSGLHYNPATLPDFGLTYLFLFGSLLVILGGAFRWYCFRTLGKQFTFELSLLKDHELVTSGPYGIVRHPSYTAAIMAILGIFLSHGTRGSWIVESGILDTVTGKLVVGVWASIMVLVIVLGIVRMDIEDAYLKKRFGKTWEEWASRVRYQLIPGII